MYVLQKSSPTFSCMVRIRLDKHTRLDQLCFREGLCVLQGTEPGNFSPSWPPTALSVDLHFCDVRHILQQSKSCAKSAAAPESEDETWSIKWPYKQIWQQLIFPFHKMSACASTDCETLSAICWHPTCVWDMSPVFWGILHALALATQH